MSLSSDMEQIDLRWGTGMVSRGNEGVRGVRLNSPLLICFVWYGMVRRAQGCTSAEVRQWWPPGAR